MSLEKTLTSGSTPEMSGNWNVPSHVGKYEVHNEVGRGACGVVYRGFDPFVQRVVAVKIGLGESKVDTDNQSPDSNAFFVEARAAGMLQHPHIVSLFDAGVEGKLNYIVMEFIDGETLREFCRRNGKRLSTTQVVDSIFKCSKALDYSHGKGVMHRDIKPGNIMLRSDGVVKIMDFSVAKLTQGRDNAENILVGSPLYMAPEQIRREPPTPQSDFYSLGAVMYELLVGEPPFMSKDIDQLFEAIQRTPAPAMANRRPDLPKELCDIVDRMLLKNPRQRFQNGQELASALTRIFDKLRYTGDQLARRENQDVLRQLGFFNDFADTEIDEILNVSTMVSFKKDEVIIQEGDIDNTFYILALGAVEVRKGNKVLQNLGKGDCFGEIGFLMKTKRTATIVATSPVVVLKINATQMQQVSKDCQLRYYKVFTENLIYRLSFTSAKLAAMPDNKS